MSVRHVLKASDLSKAEILRVLSGAKSLKLFPEQFAHVLKQKTLLMLFEKPSLRTRVSFETGMTQLGGHGIFYSTGSGDSTVGKKESIHDTAKTVSRYVDIIMARMKSRKDVQELARYATVPVINALDDFAHPCQVLADLQTIVEVKGGLEGIKFSYVGDVANNMTYDLMRACALLGVEMRVGGPDPEKYGDEYAIEKEVLEECEISGPGKVKVLHNAHEAVQGADIVYTDTWMSYHLSEEKMESRMKTLLPFRVDSDLLNLANPSAVFMHCLPAQRGHEVDANVIDGEKSIVFNQAENRLHAQKSLMLFLLGKLV